LGSGSGLDERRADRAPAWRHMSPYYETCGHATRPRHAATPAGPLPRGQRALPRPQHALPQQDGRSPLPRSRPCGHAAARQHGRASSAPACSGPPLSCGREVRRGEPSAPGSPKAVLAQGRAGQGQAAAVPAAPALRGAHSRASLTLLGAPACARVCRCAAAGRSSRSSSRRTATHSSTWTRRPSRMRSERRTQQRPAWSTQPGSCGAAFTEPGTQRGHKYCGSAALALWLCASVAVCFCGRMRVCVPLLSRVLLPDYHPSSALGFAN
jgi:hypothetical protein